MKKLNSLQFTLALLGLLMCSLSSLGQDLVSLEDFGELSETSWEGTLTYADYQSGELTPISTTMQVLISPKGIEQSIQYTYEPNKNIKTRTKIRKKGAYLGKQKVISKSVDPDGTVTINTSYKGKDDNRKATIYYTYTFNSSSYSVIKEVLFDGSEERIFRNSYEYKRI